MNKAKILKELKEGRKSIRAALAITDLMIVDLEFEIKRENEDWGGKGPGGEPNGCPAL